MGQVLVKNYPLVSQLTTFFLGSLTPTGLVLWLSLFPTERARQSRVQDDWMSGVPIQRLIDPMETAAAVTWLCLPSSSGVRGISLAVDGGRMRSI